MPELPPTDPGHRVTARLRRHVGSRWRSPVVVLVGAIAMLVTAGHRNPSSGRGSQPGATADTLTVVPGSTAAVVEVLS